ncbi:MAG: haloacid dehalogenase type II [Alphaproteobacteria bacterium]|nr:haloacid dehalogenase type II [Alphaproteobacteria bacterium]
MTAFDASGIRALAFDVFGTTVDWCSGIAREAEALLAPRGYALDWTAFANRWRREYQPAMDAVRTGARDYVTMDRLHLEMLDAALDEFGVGGLSADEKCDFAFAWRKLDPWPDTIAGMLRLKSRFTLAALSNANIALAVAMARRAGLPWDVVLGAELVGTYKPMPAIYDSAPAFLGVEPGEVMMVACHVWDLRAAAGRGLRTAYVWRPDEYGPGSGGPPPEPGEFNVVATDFLELAERLGA